MRLARKSRIFESVSCSFSFSNCRSRFSMFPGADRRCVYCCCCKEAASSVGEEGS
ncbi:hypothetical protein BDB00DRAFT_832096 [Zychaea mexicana]|uniref:uncharacterized protein n=1 Tax=Zychaea mexicana TaxID=64656 RepID=UPI0022FE2B35|nr:uncharacterized protein BDB00DRAFT_832096 [Zychaea mexicana]KAI9491589.1 hypothetical protein BDB00DRAFT_832096 [Zychaea mexicana]